MPDARSKSLIDKLGVKNDSIACVLGVTDHDFWKQLKARSSAISKGRVEKDSDFIFFLAQSKEDLVQLASFQDFIKQNGAIWVIWPKGKQLLKEKDIIQAGIAAGFVDIKVVRFSETHSALKLVIPVQHRQIR